MLHVCRIRSWTRFFQHNAKCRNCLNESNTSSFSCSGLTNIHRLETSVKIEHMFQNVFLFLIFAIGKWFLSFSDLRQRDFVTSKNQFDPGKLIFDNYYHSRWKWIIVMRCENNKNSSMRYRTASAKHQQNFANQL